MKKIGCLHAHHSNITYIESVLSPLNVETLHFVEPGLLNRLSLDENFSLADAREKVSEQMSWISACDVDSILITCTNYIALLEELQTPVSMPVIKIDEPFFAHICKQQQPQILLFSNPATVEGTMKRLNQFAADRDQQPNLEVRVIENTFELIMKNKTEAYVEKVSDYIKKLALSDSNRLISVAQLSMVEAADRMGQEMKIEIGNPLKTLRSYLESV